MEHEEIMAQITNTLPQAQATLSEPVNGMLALQVEQGLPYASVKFPEIATIMTFAEASRGMKFPAQSADEIIKGHAESTAPPAPDGVTH